MIDVDDVDVDDDESRLFCLNFGHGTLGLAFPVSGDTLIVEVFHDFFDLERIVIDDQNIMRWPTRTAPIIV